MAYFDRWDICMAYRALENDYNYGGWLPERPSNARRREATHVQLERIDFEPPLDIGCSFETLENDNQRDIYIEALKRFGLPLNEDDETHAAIFEHMAKG